MGRNHCLCIFIDNGLFSGKVGLPSCSEIVTGCGRILLAVTMISRLNHQGLEEIQGLAKSFNDMAGKVERVTAAVAAAFRGDVSHN
jgi:hypothetical protein